MPLFESREDEKGLLEAYQKEISEQRDELQQLRQNELEHRDEIDHLRRL
jgi:septal ring factor EnvC (AmiA/AmiB activator)